MVPKQRYSLVGNLVLGYIKETTMQKIHHHKSFYILNTNSFLVTTSPKREQGGRGVEKGNRASLRYGGEQESPDKERLTGHELVGLEESKRSYERGTVLIGSLHLPLLVSRFFPLPQCDCSPFRERGPSVQSMGLHPPTGVRALLCGKAPPVISLRKSL